MNYSPFGTPINLESYEDEYAQEEQELIAALRTKIYSADSSLDLMPDSDDDEDFGLRLHWVNRSIGSPKSAAASTGKKSQQAGTVSVCFGRPGGGGQETFAQ